MVSDVGKGNENESWGCISFLFSSFLFWLHISFLLYFPLPCLFLPRFCAFLLDGNDFGWLVGMGR